MEFLEKYLKEIIDISPQDKEYTYRAALQTLMQSMIELNAPSLTIKHEPNNDKEGRGAPDFVILSQGLSVGYVENKRVNADLDSVVQSPQIAKYLSLSDNLMLTDYLRFCLVRKDSKNKAQIVQEIKVCDFNKYKSLNQYLGGGGTKAFRI